MWVDIFQFNILVTKIPFRNQEGREGSISIVAPRVWHRMIIGAQGVPNIMAFQVVLAAQWRSQGVNGGNCPTPTRMGRLNRENPTIHFYLLAGVRMPLHI